MYSVLFGVNIGADADGKESASFEKPSGSTESAKPKFDMEDMDTSGPSETKKAQFLLQRN